MKHSRIYKLSVTNPGGNASKNAKKYRLILPSAWVKEMGISPEERYVSLTFNGSEITVRRAETNEVSRALEGSGEETALQAE